MQRRSLVAGAVAVAAVAAGAGVAWRRFGEGSNPDLTDFWTLRFEQPQGGEIATASLRGQPVLLNFWATWCPPCVTEMPLIDAFSREQAPRGWRVLGLAVDSPTPVREFLQKRPVSFAVGLAGLNGVELGRTLGNGTGALPFSVAIGRNGQVFQRKLGALKPADLDAWARAAG